MNYHKIKKDDMLNGSGLRVVLFLSGCSHECPGCHNPETWDANSGKIFSTDEMDEILSELRRKEISGLTITGGDPLYESNLGGTYTVAQFVKTMAPEKTIWLYTGYLWEDIIEDPLVSRIIAMCDVVVDGEYVAELNNENYPWAGSTNQRVIDVKKSIEKKEVVIWEY